MSNFQKAVKTWWDSLTDAQQEQAAQVLNVALRPPAVNDQETDDILAQGKVMLNDAYDNLAFDLRRATIDRAQKAEAQLQEWLPEVERLKGLAGEWNDPEYPIKGFFMENCIAFWQAAEKRYESHGDVDALLWSQHRLNPDWEVRDYYAQEGIAAYRGAEIRNMLRERGYVNADIHIDEAKDYKMPHSPGGGASLWRMCDWGNAYYYKAMCHYAGVESVAITNFGTIIGIEERLITEGAKGVVSRFIRPYTSDPGSVLDRDNTNAIIWPEPADYTEIRF